MKKVNIFGIIAIIITAIGTLLPFTIAKDETMVTSVSYLKSGDGVIVLVACALALVLVILGKNIWLIICGIINLAMVITDGFICFKDVISVKGVEQHIFRGIGIWVILIGAILMIVSFFINKKV